MNLNEYLANIRTHEDMLIVTKTLFSSKIYLVDRIKELIEIYNDENNSEEISIESFKSMIKFLYNLSDFNKPEVTLNDWGTFNISWKKDNDNLLSIKFEENSNLHYIIFMSSKRNSKFITLNGKMNVLDFIDIITKLQLEYI